VKGAYRFVSQQHFQRYVTELEFRNNPRYGLGFKDGERTALAVNGIEGKRLTCRPAS
jgi:hypothetical protein